MQCCWWASLTFSLDYLLDKWQCWILFCKSGSDNLLTSGSEQTCQLQELALQRGGGKRLHSCQVRSNRVSEWKCSSGWQRRAFMPVAETMNLTWPAAIFAGPDNISSTYVIWSLYSFGFWHLRRISQERAGWVGSRGRPLGRACLSCQGWSKSSRINAHYTAIFQLCFVCMLILSFVAYVQF